MRKMIPHSRIRTTAESELRKVYSEFRSIANKRIQRLNKQGLGQNRSLFPTIKDISESSKSTIASALANVQTFLRSERTTVSGEKKFLREFKETMIEKGYSDLVETTEDIYNMIDYMEYLREQYSEKLFDSGDALDVLQQGERLNIPPDMLKESYDLFASNLDKMEKLRKSPKGAEFSRKRLNTLIKKWS